MYFPIIRGRQYELQAIRECLKDNVLSEKEIEYLEQLSSQAATTINRANDSKKYLQLMNRSRSHDCYMK